MNNTPPPVSAERKYLLTLIILLYSWAAGAQSTVLRHVRVSGNPVLVVSNAEKWISNADRQKSGKLQVLVHLLRLPSLHDRNVLAEYGVELQDFIEDRTFIAIVNRERLNQVPPVLSGITDIDPHWKISDHLLKKNTGNKELLNILASFYAVVPDAEIKELVQKLDGVIELGDLQQMHIYRLKLPGNKLTDLAAYYGLRYISGYFEPKPLNFQSRSASKANLASLATAYGGYGLDGSGVTVGVGDNVSGNYHIDLKDRIINYNPASYTDHGVHINGIVGGAGIIDPKGEGVAPAAILVDHFFSAIWERTGVFRQQYNMTITNNSYAAVVRDCSYSGTYDVQSIAVDKMALQYPDVLHVFASGNDGDLSCTPYAAGFATVTGGYQPAKNNIVVTSTDKNYVNAADGSRGPVRDGRLKPEITAVGVDVNSATKTEEYLVAGGTSMACPGVAGGLALLTQRYRQLNSNNNPRADVLKALILNGTTDIGNPGPDYRFGFGFMNLYRSLQMLDNNRYITNSVANGAQQSFTITVPPNTARLKVMLTYHDVAASPMAAKVLVNDLDIEVSDAASVTHKPLVLDHTPSNILNNAAEKEDRLNNTEQVTINDPAPGTYTVTVKGFNVPSSAQDYVVSYDFVPSGVMLTYPTTGAAVMSTDSLRIYWDASDNNNSFTLEYSLNNGSSWNVIDNNIPADRRHYVWFVPANINTGKCRMRLIRNNTGQQHVTGSFVINTQPILSLDAVQCPGYIRINWAGIPGASAYEVLMKKGPKMQVIATTSMATHTISGLSADSTYYLAVRPVIDGITGYRSLALKRKPSDGSCAGNISDGDIMLQQIGAPVSGRRFTSTELKSNERLIVAVHNLDDVKVDSFRISYRINGGAWQAQVVTAAIAANSTATITIPNLNLFAPGIYKLDVAVSNLSISDPVSSNDSLSKTVRQLNNPVVSLTGNFVIDFENWGVVETINDSIGISPDDRWDYVNESDTCRLRSFINPTLVISGNRSVSLDAILAAGTAHQNRFTGTFNMANYNVNTDEVRMEFDYILHGKPQRIQDNYVAVRGQDTKNWQSIYQFRSTTGGTGKTYNSGSLSITDALQDDNQLLSTSTQIDFLQNDKSLISDRNYGSGLTIDNIKLYTVQNDIQLLSVVSPAIIECGLSGSVPLVIKVRNGVNQALSNVQLYYSMDNGPVINEVLGSINGKQTIDYTFNAKPDVSQKGGHVLNIWVAAAGDTYMPNDSILNYTFHNQPLITSFPYLENFENGDGYWYSEGLNNSWAYGTPASAKINKAASGAKVWKTNLTGSYNALELSYLYSPCFDVSKLSYPKYRFRLAHDIEDCGAILCDAARMEYSSDGINWLRLNDSTGSTNWYTDTSYNIWTGDKATWHQAVVKLPKGLQVVRFRYAFSSDPGGERDGIAVDDVEIFDDIPVPAEDNLINISPNPTWSGNINMEWSAKGGSVFGLVMFNSVGKEVYNYTAVSNEGYNKANITTPRFASGVYIMRIIIGNKKFSRKIVYL